jgi:predicted nucleic acid-binding protein
MGELDSIKRIAEDVYQSLGSSYSEEAEIFYGIESLTGSQRRQALVEAAEGLFAEDLADRILGFDSDAAGGFAKVAGHRRALGQPISHADAKIAAIAEFGERNLQRAMWQISGTPT